MAVALLEPGAARAEDSSEKPVATFHACVLVWRRQAPLPQPSPHVILFPRSSRAPGLPSTARPPGPVPHPAPAPGIPRPPYHPHLCPKTPASCQPRPSGPLETGVVWSDTGLLAAAAERARHSREPGAPQRAAHTAGHGHGGPEPGQYCAPVWGLWLSLRPARHPPGQP